RGWRSRDREECQHENRDVSSKKVDREGDSTRSSVNGTSVVGGLFWIGQKVSSLRAHEHGCRRHRHCSPVQGRLRYDREGIASTRSDAKHDGPEIPWVDRGCQDPWKACGSHHVRSETRSLAL